MISIAYKKKKENIAEYLLYMWQMEDLIRACNFEIDIINDSVLAQIEDDGERESSKKWFVTLINQMRESKLVKAGHVEEVNEVLMELYYLHTTLVNVLKDGEYIKLYSNVLPNLRQYQNVSDSLTVNEVEICLTAVYGVLILRLKKTEVSEATKSATDTFTRMLAYLSASYIRMKNGELNFQLN
jgi:Domain of unknown function (DUF4924)